MTAPALSSLRQRVLRAGGWGLAGHASSQVIRLGSNLVLTRLLVPEAFGVIAIASIISVVLYMLSDLGLRQNIIQSRRGEDPDFLDTAWTVQVIRGVVLWLLALVVSAALHLANQRGLLMPESVYALPVLPAIVAVNSFAIVIQGFESTKIAIAFRNFEQRRIVQIDLIAQLAGGIVMLALAAISRSVWAIVAGGLFGALISTTLGHLWISGHRNRIRWEPSALRELIVFGKWAIVSSAFTVLAANGDRLMLAAFIDAKLLGLYAIAMIIISAAEGALGKVFSTVSLPALSETARNDPSRLREVYYKLRLPSDGVLLFTAGFLFAAGQPVIDALYDPRYAEAGWMLQILALSLIFARYGVAYQIYLAVGAPRYMAIIQIAKCVSLFTLVPASFYVAGVQAAIWAVALHGLVMLPFVYGFNSRLGLNDTRRETLVLGAFLIGLGCGWVLSRIWG